MAPILGYWNIRGLAQPIRLMLAYAEVEFEDKKYAYGPAPQYDRGEWGNVKNTLGLDFPNLPYYIDGDVKLTQSISIMKYIASKHNLSPKTDEELIRADLVEQQAADFRMNLAMICYNPEFEQLKVEFLKALPNKLREFSEYLGKRNWFASADKLTYVDFMMYEALDQHKLLDAECLQDFGNLQDFLTRFENLPTIKAYMNSADFMKFPLNGDMAKWGSRSSQAK